jgi:hypothetical protein
MNGGIMPRRALFYFSFSGVGFGVGCVGVGCVVGSVGVGTTVGSVGVGVGTGVVLSQPFIQPVKSKQREIKKILI